MSTLISKNEYLISKKASIIKPGVELIGIINQRGRMIESIGYGDIGLDQDKKEMFLMKIALRAAMQRDFDEYLREVRYCMTLRENRKFISIPTFNKNTILIITKSDFEHESLVNDIIQTLRYSGEFLGESIQVRQTVH